MIIQCWQENLTQRPDFSQISQDIKNFAGTGNIMDQMQMSTNERMEQWNKYLEEQVQYKTQQINEEKQKTENFLNRMLPPSVAWKLTRGIPVEPESYSNVTIFFSDIVGFTQMSSQATPFQVISKTNNQ